MSKYNTELPAADLNKSGIAIAEGWLTVYSVEPEQREYHSASMEYLPVGVGLPALSYADKPELPGDGLALVRSADGTQWENLPDFRGTEVYHTATGEPQTVTTIGELPQNVTLLAPRTPYDKWDGSKWVTDASEQARVAVDAARLEMAHRQQIVQRTIEPLERAIKLGMATEEEQAALTAWETYSVLLNRVDITKAPDIEWPQQPN